MSDVDRLFVRLKAEGRKGFLPFITAGDPDLAFTARLLKRLEELGCSMAELGIPYSDPIADGPVIQASYQRALGKHLKWRSVVQMLEETKPHRSMPVVTMVSYAIMYRHGLERFVDEAQKAGVAGAIVPDLLVEESGPLAKICRDRDFSLIQLVTPTTPEERALRIAESSSGFLYFVSVTGITGERTELPEGLADRVQWLRSKTPLPICIGFGISRPEHVRLLAPVADGLIVGSAMVRLLAQHDADGPDRVLERVDGLVKELMEPLSKAGE
jgi:tryptophan synthase alpha chain